MFSLYRVTFGKSVKFFYAWHHAEQFARALRLNGTKVTVQSV